MTEEMDLLGGTAPGTMRQYDIHIAKLPSGTIVNMHVYVYRGKKDGPTLLLSGGLHGDEVNGIEIIRRMVSRGMLQPDVGNVIAIPVLNIYGFLNFDRDLPDGKDANRSFPGFKNGSLASQVAWHLQKKILPIIDLGVDFHTGGGRRFNYPQIRCDMEDKQSMILAQAFAPPFILHSSTIPGSLRNEAQNQGKTIIVYEAGQALRFDEFAIEEGIQGTQRLLHRLQMKEAEETLEKEWEPLILNKMTWIRAEEAGLFNYTITEGTLLHAGQLVGVIADPFNNYEVPVRSTMDGYVIGLNHSPVINHGDALVHLAYCDNLEINPMKEITPRRKQKKNPPPQAPAEERY